MDQLATQAVVRVGRRGRGFLIAQGGRRFVVTAAHCLPRLPKVGRRHRYLALLGRLDGARLTASAECLFVDPVADIAVLGVRGALARDAVPLRIARSRHKARAWLLAHNGTWARCRVSRRGSGLWISGANGGIASGMSGSPILNAAGRAIGVLCCSRDSSGGGPNPNLSAHLPAWLLPPPKPRR
jgi:hypothetical protein